MVILLTNDDGIHAAGINTLFEALSPLHDVYMIAPSEERSACSNAITMRDELTIRRYDDRRFSVNGFPADCANVGLHGDIIPSPDIVISGINHGPNLGDDIYYSGTVAGARVGFIHGKNAIAVSLSSKERLQYLGDAAAYTVSFISQYAAVLEESRRFININYPARSKDSVQGTAFTFLDKRSYMDRFIIRKKEGSDTVVLLEGTVGSAAISGSDYDMVTKGFVSVTPLKLDSTNYEERDYFSTGR